MVDERYLMQGLTQRGLPEHVAQGFVMNMRNESGLNPGINEISPTVPGSRGGFGLYQLTGPRRRAYEQFAQERGTPLDNPDAQLDFLMTELQGPESRAAQSIFSTQTPQDAAVAIARDFLRPAPENLQKRVQQYTGGNMQRQPQGLLGNPTISTQGQAPQQAPAQEEKRAPFFQRPGVANAFDTLAMGLQGMTFNPNQALIQGAQQRIQQRRETGQMEQQRNRTVEALKQMDADPQIIQLAESGYADAALKEAIRMRRGAQYRTITGQEAADFGLDPGKAYNVGADGKITAIGGGGITNVIGGGEQATPFQEAVDKNFADRYLDWKTSGSADTSQQVAQISSVLSELEGGEELTGPVIAAIQKVGLGPIFTPDATDARERVESVVQRSLRETLGAQFTEKEGERLISRAYNPALPPEKNAARLRALYMTLSAADKAKKSMIDYVEQNGTLAGYSGPGIPTASQMEAAMDSASPSGAGGATGGNRIRYDAEGNRIK